MLALLLILLANVVVSVDFKNKLCQNSNEAVVIRLTNGMRMYPCKSFKITHLLHKGFHAEKP